MQKTQTRVVVSSPIEVVSSTNKQPSYITFLEQYNKPEQKVLPIVPIMAEKFDREYFEQYQEHHHNFLEYQEQYLVSALKSICNRLSNPTISREKAIKLIHQEKVLMVYLSRILKLVDEIQNPKPVSKYADMFKYLTTEEAKRERYATTAKYFVLKRKG